MIGTPAFLAFIALGAADVTAATPSLGSLPAFHTAVETPIAHPSRVTGRLALRSPLLETPDRPHAVSFGSALAQTAPAPATASPAPAGDASAAPAEEEPDIELMRHRAAITRIHRPLGIITFSSLVVTETLGTLLAINQHTLFGAGVCNNMVSAGNPCIFGDFGGQGGLASLHEFFAFTTLGFYTATGVFALAMPDPEHASRGNDIRANRLRLHKTMAYIHLAGMILEPILGILSYDPGVIGISTHDRDNFQADLRTVHLGVGYVTLAALTTAMILELLN